jgi:hypothetical protein
MKVSSQYSHICDIDFYRIKILAYATLLYHPSGKEMDAEPTNYVECRLCAKIFTRSGGHLK